MVARTVNDAKYIHPIADDPVEDQIVSMHASSHGEVFVAGINGRGPGSLPHLACAFAEFANE